MNRCRCRITCASAATRATRVADAANNPAALLALAWHHAGDGRGAKDMVIRGGENIYPREIEDFIFAHPKVAEIAVFGIPDDYYGEEIMAWIQLHEDVTATEAEIRAFCKDRIAHFKIPKYIWFVDEFPMTVTGKLQKFRMREIAIEKLDLATQGSR